MMCTRSKSAALRMFFTRIVAMASDDIKTKGLNFKGDIYFCKILYQYHNRFAFVSRTSASFPQFQTLIVFISLNYSGLVDLKVDIAFSEIYWLSTGYKLLARHTAEKPETLTVVKLARNSLITKKIQIFVLIQKQRLEDLL